MLDLPSLLAPIADGQPCGEDLSYSAEFDAIQEFRRADDPSLDQGEWVTELKSADWPAVASHCSALLQARSKDLRLAAWLTEAHTRLHGFAGLDAGLRLTAGLCDRYWETLHPELDGEENELRTGTIAWLLNQSIQWVRSVPLTDGAQGRYAQVDFEAARSRHAHEGGESHLPAPAQLEAARAATAFAFYQRLAAEAPACLQALQALQDVVDARLGQQGPSFAATRDAFESAVHTALRFARDAGVHADGSEQLAAASPAGDASPPPADRPADASSSRAIAHGEIGSRKEALAQLRKVAEFFRRTEPHSPVAYLADKAARWGSMPLHVWLKSVVKDSGSLAHLEELLDVGPDESRDA
ncbi:type VI secretion protein [Frateuria sp. Soil773]|uniref:type VI secretion system protein TssA n=1 Tax=Frateuria sp. Soil773 TaxID=1736407 RepID=UPI0006FF24FA|nr:type VI secretion system protein TssA [Frateuria sp. Soil773]KRE92416.1 type VI secretion protein [Frateuria sp. Soil773]